jgi:hypothetical protein
MHANDLQVLKESQSFLDNYHMKFRMKWIVINYNPQYNIEDLSSQVGVENIYFNFLQTQSSLKSFMFWFNLIFLVNSCHLNHLSHKGGNTQCHVFLEVSRNFVELINKGINLEAEDVLYNYINATFMTRSEIRRAFHVAKQFHLITL